MSFLFEDEELRYFEMFDKRMLVFRLFTLLKAK